MVTAKKLPTEDTTKVKESNYITIKISMNHKRRQQERKRDKRMTTHTENNEKNGNRKFFCISNYVKLKWIKLLSQRYREAK